MICISVTPTSRKLAKADLLNASRHCDLVELCLDHLIKEPDVGDLVKATGKPVLVSCRRPQDGGHFQGSDEDRIKLLRQAIGAGPAYVELELDIAGSIPRFGATKRVISYTSLDKPLGKVEEIFDEANEVHADVVKFTWPTPTLDAAWPLLAAVTKKRQVPVVGEGLGRAGLMFSLLGRKYGSPWIYAALEKGMEAHPGQATIWELDDVYAWREIGPQTRLVGICGFGFSDEATVRIFNAGFKRLGMNTRCLPLALGRLDNLARMLDVLKIKALVVSPLIGQHILEFAPHAEDAARESGHADLLLKQPDGWTGYNTIWRSTLKAAEAALGKKTPEDRPLDRKRVLIIGAAGTARALVHGFQLRQGLISIADPDDAAALEVARKFGLRHVPWATLYDTLADVVALTDPAIAVGHRKTELSPAFLRETMMILDVGRLPAETEFLSEARARGCRTVEPRAIYLDQISSQFKSFTGKELPAEAIDEFLPAAE